MEDGIEFTREDCKAIASLDISKLASILSPEEYIALDKFIFVNKTMIELNDGVSKQ